MRLHSEHRRATQFNAIRAMMQDSDAYTVAELRANTHRIVREYFPAVAFAALVDVGGQRLLSFAAVHPVTVGDFEARWRQECGRVLGRKEHDCLLLDFHVRPGEREVWDGEADELEGTMPLNEVTDDDDPWAFLDHFDANHPGTLNFAEPHDPQGGEQVDILSVAVVER